VMLMEFLKLNTILLAITLVFLGAFTYNLNEILNKKSKINKFYLGRVYVGWFAGIILFFLSSLIFEEIQNNNIVYIVIFSSLSGVFGYTMFGFIVKINFIKKIFNRLIFMVTGINMDDKNKNNKKEDSDKK